MPESHGKGKIDETLRVHEERELDCRRGEGKEGWKSGVGRSTQKRAVNENGNQWIISLGLSANLGWRRLGVLCQVIPSCDSSQCTYGK